MKELVIGIALGAALAIAIPASAMTELDCTAVWKRADISSDGRLWGEEAVAYLSAMIDAGMKPTDDNMISAAEFMKACEAGAFDKMTPLTK